MKEAADAKEPGAVRTWRAYLSCFYRLTRTSGPDEDENEDDDGGDDNDGDDDDGDDDDDDVDDDVNDIDIDIDDDGDDDKEKARNKVGERRTARSGERWKVATRESAGGRG